MCLTTSLSTLSVFQTSWCLFLVQHTLTHYMLVCLYDAVYARPLCESAAGSNGKPFSLVNNSVDHLPFFQRRRFSTSPTFRILMILIRPK